MISIRWKACSTQAISPCYLYGAKALTWEMNKFFVFGIEIHILVGFITSGGDPFDISVERHSMFSDGRLSGRLSPLFPYFQTAFLQVPLPRCVSQYNSLRDGMVSGKKIHPASLEDGNVTNNVRTESIKPKWFRTKKLCRFTTLIRRWNLSLNPLWIAFLRFSSIDQSL